MSDELTRYVFTHYCALMTDAESSAWRHLQTTYKLTGGRSDPDAQREVAEHGGLRRRWLSDEPIVLDLAAEGIEAFQTRVAERILREHPQQVLLNHCRRCGGLTRTPTAKLCLHCGHAWHSAPAV